MYKYPTYSAPMLIPNPKNPHELKVDFVSHPKFHKESTTAHPVRAVR